MISLVDLDKMPEKVEPFETLFHDINNMLTVILGNACLARACVPQHSFAQIYLKEIEEASRRMTELFQALGPSVCPPCPHEWSGTLTTFGTDRYPG